MQEAYDINFNKNHELHTFFKTYEIFSYFKGAIIATTNKEIQYPHRLVHNVLINQIKRLPELKKGIPSVTQFIQDHKEQIDQLFVFVENSDFLTKSAPNGKSKEEYITAFEDAKAIRENELR
ncbi:TPA: hypothetical protein DEP21_01050 [Patescibacteria group bacterium]|nr:hypothetical protein [Candidatus Gracilibacteria bacterium]